jgi:ABC-2 type transport system permease protein
MILLYGYAITFDVKEIRLGVVDEDRTPASRALVDDLISSKYFILSSRLQDRSEIEEALLNRRMLAVVVIPAGFSADRGSKPLTEVQVIIDGSNANTATVAINYIKSFFISYSLAINEKVLKPPVDLQPRVWYNPDLKSAHFIVPGLVAVIMMLICALLTSVTVARERETGTMEQILVSPIRSVEIIFGKTVPYMLLALLDAVLVVVFALVVFGVPFRGDPLWLLAFSIVYVYACLSFGIFISARVKTQQVALMAAQLATVLPSVLLSGFIFPILSLPMVLQLVTYIVPAKYFLVIIRGIMLKGIGGPMLWQPALFLAIFGTVLLLISVGRFKTNLEG